MSPHPDLPPFSMSCRVCSHFKRGDIEAAALGVPPPLDGDEARAFYEAVDDKFFLPHGCVRRHMLQCVPVIGLKVPGLNEAVVVQAVAARLLGDVTLAAASVFNLEPTASQAEARAALRRFLETGRALF